MNAVEIEQAVSELAAQPFDPQEFPFAFLRAYGNKETTLKKLRAGAGAASDVPGAVLQRNHIHIKVCAEGEVDATLGALRDSPKTATAKARFILATDGKRFQAEDLAEGVIVDTDYASFPDRFGVFLPLAGISTVKEIKESSFDIKATGRLNRLYVELLNSNPDWAKAERRPDMNHFMARLIFCFFAEDTDIFHGEGLFTHTVQQMSADDSSNTHEVIAHIFLAMNTPTRHNGAPDGRYRRAADIRPWADAFPYVNGGLFSGSLDVPVFSRLARSYLISIGNLNWRRINPDIFGSMIQAVADDDERGALGMHYTSVPNILKVLNPLFLDDLREKLEEAGTNGRKLLNLRNRMARIRVFDPACGSGNFLVIAYKQMREIEAEINLRRGEADRRSDIPLTNFRGIELRDFPAEIARLALIIAEYQCDVLYRGQKEALAEFLPLNAENWIVCGNALRLDWLSICPPQGNKSDAKIWGDDLFGAPLDQARIEFENEGGETYICGNPPYLGSKWQAAEQKADLQSIFEHRTPNWKSLDYVAGWFMKAADYGTQNNASAAFVSTNSICQGQQVPILWPLIFETGHEIAFAHTSFTWKNLASYNAGVTVVIVGIAIASSGYRRLFELNEHDNSIVRHTPYINAYLISGKNTIVEPSRFQISGLPEFDRGNSPTDGGHLLLERIDIKRGKLTAVQIKKFVRRFAGSLELIRGEIRYCIWIEDNDSHQVLSIPFLRDRIEKVRSFRLTSTKAATRRAADWSYRFDERKPLPKTPIICVPVTSSENREYLPSGILPPEVAISNLAFGMPCKDTWVFSIVVSKLMISWVAAVCARMRTDYRFTNTLCWNTFPVPKLTEDDKAELTRRAEDILLAREAHYPATIADLYDPETMPQNLREAHERNDETLERIYIGRRFRNDTERLEHLFELYTRMTAAKSKPGKASA